MWRLLESEMLTINPPILTDTRGILVEPECNSERCGAKGVAAVWSVGWEEIHVDIAHFTPT